MPHLTEDIRRCVQACMECAALCHQTVMHCLEMGGRHAQPLHIRHLLDCAELNQSHASILLRGGRRDHLVQSMIEIASDCAASCDQFVDDVDMRDCAASCRRCVEACRPLLGMREAA